ncbi:polymeric immunoglobulin receptor-like [Leptodactylus fuscus]
MAVSSYLFGPSEVTGALGGSVTVSCYYDSISANIHGRKFWCKMTRHHCITIISTNYIVQNYINRTHLQNYRDNFKINMTNLQPNDSGIYRCGIGNNNNRLFYVVNVTVSEGNKIPYSSEVIITNIRSSITINCPLPQEPNGTGWKYWCKKSNVVGAACHTMVNSSGYVHPHFWGRALIQKVANTSHFQILVNNIKLNDLGFYQCGTETFEDGSRWTDLHIHILNSPHKIKYQISMSLTRSPGELVVAECRVPTSFHDVSLMYWCRWHETGCLRLVDSHGFIQEGFQHRLSLNFTSRLYTITLSQLQLEDTGHYWCVITDGHKVETSSVKLNIFETTTALSSQVYIQELTSQDKYSSLLTTTNQQENTSTISRNPNTGSTVEYISSVLPTQRSTALTHPTPTEQETRINVTLRPSSLEPLSSTVDPAHTVLNTEMSKSSTGQESPSTTEEYISSFLPTKRRTALTHSTSSEKESPSTTEEYISSFLPTKRRTALTHSTPSEKETHINVTLRPSSLETLPSTTDRSHTVLNTEMSKSSTEQGYIICYDVLPANHLCMSRSILC